jgi:hypothetical protein
MFSTVIAGRQGSHGKPPPGHFQSSRLTGYYPSVTSVLPSIYWKCFIADKNQKLMGATGYANQTRQKN